MNLEEAKTYILSSIPEIGNVSISLSPFWHTVIPTVKSRIQFAFE